MMEFLTYSNNRRPLDAELVAFALSCYYTQFKCRPPLARVHPTMLATMQAIIASLHGRLDVVANGGTFSDEVELAKPLSEKYKLTLEGDGTGTEGSNYDHNLYPTDE